MRDDQHLVPLAQRPHLARDRVRDLAAHVRVDLVEHQQRHGVLIGQRAFTASITRLISPLDPMERSGFGGSPGFGANKNSTVSKPLDRGENTNSMVSNPFAPGASSWTRWMSNSLFLKPRSRSCSRTAPESNGAAFSRSLLNARQPSAIHFAHGQSRIGVGSVPRRGPRSSATAPPIPR